MTGKQKGKKKKGHQAGSSKQPDTGKKTPSPKPDSEVQELGKTAIPSIEGEKKDVGPSSKLGDVISYPLTLNLQNGEKTEIQLTPLDSVMDVRKLLLGLPETCFFTQYDLLLHDDKAGSVYNLKYYNELSDAADISTGDSKLLYLEMVAAPYDDMSIRKHIHRTRELLSCSSFHFSKSSSLARKNEADKSTSSNLGDPSKLVVIDRDKMGYLVDPSIALAMLFLPPNQETKCVESIEFSSFNPAPVHRRISGDLVYLDVETLEGNKYCITGTEIGFYVNNTSAGKVLDPRPKKSAANATTLVELLQKLSSMFKTAFKELLERRASAHPFEKEHSFLPPNSWLEEHPVPDHKRDAAKAENIFPLSFGAELIGAHRDWNEEVQSSRDLSCSVHEERILRDKALNKITTDFVDAAIKGAVGVISRSIPPKNPNEIDSLHMYIHNNIFFSYAFDEDIEKLFGRQESDTISGDERASFPLKKDATAHQTTYACANNELTGTKAYQEADVLGLHTLAIAIIDYRGHRLLAQSILPSILRSGHLDSILYGSIGNGKKIYWNEEFHSKVVEAAKHLHLKEHSVHDESGNAFACAASSTCKGKIGRDGRHYIFNFGRVTPRDANYTGPGSQHCILRPELITSFCHIPATTIEEQDTTSETKHAATVEVQYTEPEIKHAATLEGQDTEPEIKRSAIAEGQDTESENKHAATLEEKDTESTAATVEEKGTESTVATVEEKGTESTAATVEDKGTESTAATVEDKGTESTAATVEEKGTESTAATVEEKGTESTAATVEEKGTESTVEEKGTESTAATVEEKGTESSAVEEKGTESTVATVEEKGTESTAVEEKGTESTAATVEEKGTESTATVEEKGTESTAATVEEKGTESTAATVEEKDTESTAVEEKGTESTAATVEEKDTESEFKHAATVEVKDKAENKHSATVEVKDTESEIKHAAPVEAKDTESEIKHVVSDIRFNPNVFADVNLAGSPEDIEADEILVRKASDYLKNVVVPKFINDLLTLEATPMDGQTLSEELHAHGINVRYIGKVAEGVRSLRHLWDLFSNEIIVRSAKHILKDVMSDTDDYDLGRAISRFLNCLFGNVAAKKADSSPSNSKIQKEKMRKGASSMKYQNLYLRMNSDSLWSDIREFAKLKYQFELEDEARSHAKKIHVIRNLCLKVGIIIPSRIYDLKVDEPFRILDIVDLQPVVKHAIPINLEALDMMKHGKVKFAEGMLSESFKSFSAAYTILYQVTGPIHKEMANCCRHLAMLLYHAGDIDGAITQQQMELIIIERCLGLDHPDTAHSYCNLAQYYHGASKTALALSYMDRGLALLSILCGRDHPDVAETFVNIGIMYQDIGNLSQALYFFQTACENTKTILGDEHIQVAVCYHALAILYNCMEGYKLALKNEEETYKILAKVLGTEHPKTKDSKNWIGIFTARENQLMDQKMKKQASPQASSQASPQASPQA